MTGATGEAAAVIATLIGTLYGAVAGLAGRVIDGIMMRFVDIVLSIPFLFIVLVLATKYSATVVAESLLLGFFSWLVPARLVRGEVLTLRERDFVAAARVMGSGRARLIYKHLIPNALSVVIVNITFLVADSILALAFLGFLGFGLQYPTASWGDMLGNADTNISGGLGFQEFMYKVREAAAAPFPSFQSRLWKDCDSSGHSRRIGGERRQGHKIVDINRQRIDEPHQLQCNRGLVERSPDM